MTGDDTHEATDDHADPDTSGEDDVVGFTWTDSLRATAAWSAGFTALVAAVAVLGGTGSHPWTRLSSSVLLWSNPVIAHIGWALGAAFTALLGFLAVVAAVEYSGNARSRQIRKALATSSQLMAGALAPSVLVALLVPFHSPANTGALFAVIPVAAVLFFVAVVVGQFDLVDARKRRHHLRDNLIWAEAHLSRLPAGGARPVPLVLAVTALVAGGAGIGVALALRGLVPDGTAPWSMPITIGTLAGVALLGSVAVWHLAEARWTIRWPVDRMTHRLALVLHVVAALALLVVPVLHDPGYGPVGIGAALTIALLVLSSRGPASRVLGDWSLRAAAVRAARHKVEHLRARAERQLAGLERAADSPMTDYRTTS